jgi:hypothetical protein
MPIPWSREPVPVFNDFFLRGIVSVTSAPVLCVCVVGEEAVAEQRRGWSMKAQQSVSVCGAKPLRGLAVPSERDAKKWPWPVGEESTREAIGG